MAELEDTQKNNNEGIENKAHTVTFTDINLNRENYGEYFCGYDNILSNLNKVNVFVGANNSGKSRLMRRILTDRSLRFKIKEVNFDEYNKLSNDFINTFKKHNVTIGAILPEFNNISNDDFRIDFLEQRTDHSIINNLLLIVNNRFDKIFGNSSFVINELKSAYSKFKDFFLMEFDKPSNISYHLYKSIYIPSLRGLRPLQNQQSANGYVFQKNDIYLARTESDYKLKQDNDYLIYTGLSFYDDLFNLITHEDMHIRSQRSSFENFLSETFFKGDKVEIVPVKNQDVVHIRIGDVQKPIYDLGDGIQSIISLTYPLYFNQGKNIKFFFEEPETHLHPGFQRLFIDILLKPQFASFQYFFTTHSNHFLDMTLENDLISVYTFESKTTAQNTQAFKITNVENSNSNILTLLGAQNSSVFLANCTIWVEGITDRLYIRKYLQLLQAIKEIKYIENIHFSFVEYAGSNITHWSFLEDDNKEIENIKAYSVSNKIMLICDNDGIRLDIPKIDKTGKKEQRLKKLKEIFKEDSFEILKRREIENFLTVDILKQTIESSNKKGKSIDFSKLKYDKYADIYLGKYLDDKLIGSSKKYAEQSGTLKDKVNFARMAITKMSRIEDISPEAKELAEKVYKFIQKSNSIHKSFRM